MTSITSVTSPTASRSPQSRSNSISDLDLDGFLKLMITELQNQDPLNPMENSEMLQQISQMRSISASDKLTATLDAVLLGQNVSTASGLIGKEVSALTDDGQNIEGIVERVTVTPSDDDKPAAVKVHVGNSTVSLANVRAILPPTQDS